jgi:AcrR family transcriptional regulator
MTRTYQKKKRAEGEAATRQRIVEATVDLHTSVGPARTTVSAIARTAGVQRHTVYAHFPDDDSLFSACSAHWAAQHPFPAAEPPSTADELPLRRLASALRDVWAWYDEVEQDLVIFLRDAELMPQVREPLKRYDEQLSDLADRLAADAGASKAARAAIGHALAFETWQSLVRREQLSTARAIQLMLTLVEHA